MEERKDLMVSLAGDSKPTLRKGHFLKPTLNSIDGQISETPSSSVSNVTLPPFFEPKEWPLDVHFIGWRHHPPKWLQWVEKLHSKYELVWKKVGIYKAIMSTKFDIKKNEDLLYGVAHRWCSKTNTFVFPWAEATITLEDVLALGGYPVLGDFVLSPPKTLEMEKIKQKLALFRMDAGRSKARKAIATSWINLFIHSGSEIEHEHEAFLVAWLSIFVFPAENGLIRKDMFPIAIHLARGNQIALAPAVLASIYRDLALLRMAFAHLSKKNSEVGGEVPREITLPSPLYLVQIWVWERFKALQPNPNLINNGDPILARWHKVRALKVDNVRLVLDSAMEDFLWRPYVRYAAGKCALFYPENEMIIPVEPDLEKEIASFVRCMRNSELVGLGYIELYLPHRVSMQFGMDQDVPGCVPRFNETPTIAWEYYCRPISDSYLYFPPRLFEADVTSRYVRWWKNQSLLGHQLPTTKKRSPRLSKNGFQEPKANRGGNDAEVPPGFPPKRGNTMISGNSCGDGSKTKKDDIGAKRLKTVDVGNSVQGSKANENSNAAVPKCFSPKHDTLNPGNSIEHCKPTADGCKRLSDQSHGSSAASTSDYGAVKKMAPLTNQVEKIAANLEEAFEDENGRKGSGCTYESVRFSGTEGEGCSWEFDIDKMKFEERITRLERIVRLMRLNGLAKVRNVSIPS